MLVEAGRVVHRRVGPLLLWVERTADEWLVAADRAGEEERADPGDRPTPGDLPWGRWTAGAEQQVLWLRPVMPDRGVVAQPAGQVKVSRGHEAVFYVSIPLWVRVAVGAEGELVLCEEPTVVLSNTWFGEPTAGELCYSLQTRARRRAEEDEARVHRAVCPVRVTNQAEEHLEFERLCIGAPHLTVYDGEAQLWTNEVRVTFHGEGKPSEVAYAPGPPPSLEVGAPLAEPRVPPQSGLFRRTFATLRSLAGR
jgi:hypothetical protein